MKLLRINTNEPNIEIRNTPIFDTIVRNQVSELSTPIDGKASIQTPFTQYGLLGGISQNDFGEDGFDSQRRAVSDPRLFYNVATPSSIFICGSQGSGKSHSLSCLLENCLLPSVANVLPRPLTGLVFHYDTFNSDVGGTPSEAAYLSSNTNVKVRVLCAPTNRVKIEKVYSCLPNVVVSDFRIHESQLNTKRMLDLMAMDSAAGDAWPLYMHTVTRILRDMRLEQQQRREDDGFNYGDFKRRLTEQPLVGGQLGPLQQRLDALESFMVPIDATKTRLQGGNRKHGRFVKGEKTVDKTWKPKAGQLTIVDLSCPCITDATACSLFTICLSLFLEQQSEVGRVVALDEAHKYMTGSVESETLTERLLSAIRLQRHLAARVFISTQEPTISPKLLDLCSATIVHRFTSPEWLQTLKAHLAGASVLGASTSSRGSSHDDDGDVLATPVLRSGSSERLLAEIFRQIVSLRTGEALLFAPNAAVGVLMERVAQADDTSSSAQSSSASAATDDSESAAEGWKLSKDLLSFNEYSPDDAVLRPKVEGFVAAAVAAAAAAEWRPKEAIRLGSGVLKIFIRQRVTQDGGQSIMAG
ncbi:uncharacterized protein LMH87_009140 [Akanthomyces muscarius]|uniref:P-loop containing nucleoside triphosphate hydrolase n=1 Tax=Akanthomyces muscarius TaxID=2231603 RepID=A0A9W8QI90_AKAMU|nr:uncharacterized protein LMH87_009140 [Akanthomyces muscarius]KAJ4158622.1 hypothetical protein LMH87_009140 [Akanthomyces muscarius]